MDMEETLASCVTPSAEEREREREREREGGGGGGGGDSTKQLLR